LLISHYAANATVALQRAYITRAMILRMIRMSELRDPKETGAHVNRVAGYAVEIYDRWAYNHGVSEGEREKNRDTLKIAAMLHDVGKVAISDIILKKPARFTPEEYEVMKAHTVYGAQLFDDPQSPLDRIAADVALTHHENWDGTAILVGSNRKRETSSGKEKTISPSAARERRFPWEAGSSPWRMSSTPFPRSGLQAGLGRTRCVRRDTFSLGQKIRSRIGGHILRYPSQHQADQGAVSGAGGVAFSFSTGGAGEFPVEAVREGLNLFCPVAVQAIRGQAVHVQLHHEIAD
jgi:hypothetical protein